MGTGYVCKCGKCHKKYEINLGVGYGYPRVYDKLDAKIKRGAFGKEMKDFAESHENFVIDGEAALFYCPDCGAWKVTESKDLYVPKNPKKKFEYAFHRELIDTGVYELGIENPVICEKCGQPMKKLYEDDFDSDFEETGKAPIDVNSMNLKCPKCDEALKFEENDILWD